jgi:hypothetical protein
VELLQRQFEVIEFGVQFFLHRTDKVVFQIPWLGLLGQHLVCAWVCARVEEVRLRGKNTETIKKEGI